MEYIFGAEEPLSAAQLAHEVADHVVAPLIVLLSLVTVSGWFVIRAALSPLSRAAADVDRAAQTAPRGVRIDHSTFPLEAQPFAAAVNRLLERLDAVAEAQETFASDAAHELKTPLTILSLELERLPLDISAALREDVTALSRLVDQLLLLARLDAQSASETPMEMIDLGAIAAGLVASLAPIALRSSRNVAFEDCKGALVPARGTVTLVAGPGARLAVRDEGAGLTEGRLAELARRGQRADHASAHGAGLGLTIVAKIMAARFAQTPAGVSSYWSSKMPSRDHARDA